MRRRTSGKLGDGGGPGRRRDACRFFALSAQPQPPRLQKQQRRHGQQRMMAQSMPRSALEMVQTQLLFHLLMRLFARPSRLDRARQFHGKRVPVPVAGGHEVMQLLFVAGNQRPRSLTFCILQLALQNPNMQGSENHKCPNVKMAITRMGPSSQCVCGFRGVIDFADDKSI